MVSSLSIDFRLLYNNTHQGAGYDPGMHTGHFLFFFTVQNLNWDSKGYGDYYWFGIALYDSRTHHLAFRDAGHGFGAEKRGRINSSIMWGSRHLPQRLWRIRIG